MSHLDDLIASLLRNIDDLQRVIAETDLTKSHLEDLRDQYEAVGVESSTAIASATIDWVEQLQAQSPVFHAQLEALINQAEALKTGPNSTATGNGNAGTDTKPEPIATTGADPTPNPVHATPAHTREPSRKIGDPVKPPHEISQGEDRGVSRFRRGARSVARNADDVDDAIQETDSILTGLGSMDVPPDKTYGITTTASQPQMVQPTGPQVDTGDALSSATMLAVVTIDILGRIRRKKKGKL